MTTKHANCSHPNTKSARAACRRSTQLGDIAGDMLYGPAKQHRTDVHRPSAFDPEQYEYSHAGTYSGDEFLVDVRDHDALMRQMLRSEGWSWAGSHTPGQCDHCGTRIMHYAVMKHIPSHALIHIGETCLGGRFEMATAEFAAWRKLRVGANARKAKAEKLARFLNNHPTAQTILDYEGDNQFVRDLADKLRHYADLTDRQLEAAEKALTRDRQRVEEDAARAARLSSLPPLTAGNRQIAGTVVHTRWVDGDYGRYAGSLKGLIETPEGYRFWGTMPRAWHGDKGDPISITATIQPKSDDPTFAFYKRPRLV